MQVWQSGRSRAKINRIQARHPCVDLDILKQGKLVYEWVRGMNLVELFDYFSDGTVAQDPVRQPLGVQ